MNERNAAVRRVLLITLVLNLGVAAAKFVVGYLLDIVSLQAEGFHTTFDALSNVIGLIALGIATRPPDPEHPYGHRKFEVAASLVIGLMVLLGLIEVGRGIYGSLLTGSSARIEPIAYVVVIGTAVVNLFVAWYERRAGRRHDSMILLSDSAHTLSDSLAAMAVLGGIILVDFGIPSGDILAAVVVMTFIGMTAYRVLRDGIDVIVDTAFVDAEFVQRLVEAHPEVRSCHYVRSRGMQGSVHLEFHLSLDPEIRLRDAGEIMLDVKERVHAEMPDVKDILVQLEPHEAEHVDDVPRRLI
jgi:cation diffusion facilitator family transporter